MGYNTNYKLLWKDPSAPEEHNPNLNNLSGEKNARIRDWLLAEEDFHPPLELITQSGAEGFCKWPRSSEDMNRLSLEFPDVLFVLYCSGEREEDLWVSYHLRGRSHSGRAEINYPPFDRRLLD